MTSLYPRQPWHKQHPLQERSNRDFAKAENKSLRSVNRPKLSLLLRAPWVSLSIDRIRRTAHGGDMEDLQVQLQQGQGECVRAGDGFVMVRL